MSTNIKALFGKLSGASFVGIDTVTDVKLPKNMPGTRGKNAVANPHHGHVKKTVRGASVMMFGNSKSNAYENMVKRRLEKEGKDPNSFMLSERAWGKRIPGTPIVVHEKNGEVSFYIEMIFLNSGKTSYELDGKAIQKDDIIGLAAKSSSNGQGGLEDKVQIRTIRLDSITAIRTEGQEFTGPFIFEE